MPRNLLLAAALVTFVAPSAHAEPIILCGWDTVFVVDVSTTNTETKPIWT